MPSTYDIWQKAHRDEVLRIVRGGNVSPAKTLGADGRCCGRKPLEYRRTGTLFCTRCDREYAIGTGAQQSNWGWRAVPGGFVPGDTSVGAAVSSTVFTKTLDQSKARAAVKAATDGMRRRFP